MAPLEDPQGLTARLRAEHRKLDAVRELNRALGATLDLDRLLVLLLDKVTELLDAERATLFLVNDSGDELSSKVTQGGAVQEIRLKLGEGIAGWVARSGATVNLPDAYADPRFQKDVDQRTGFRTRSVLCMAMPDHQGRIIGAVQVLNKRTGTFDADDEAMLGAVAAHSGIAIENSKLYLSLLKKNAALEGTQQELRRKVADLDLLVEIERESSEATDFDDLLDRLLTRAMQLVEAEAGAVLLRDQHSGELFFRSALGGAGAAIKRTKLDEGQGIVGWVATHKQPAIVNDPATDSRHDALLAEWLSFRPRDVLAVPLVDASAEGGVESLGAIELLNRRGRGYTPGSSVGVGFDLEDMKLLMLIAGHASRALLLTRARQARIKEDRLAAIGQLLSGVLHDLKTPLTVVSGYVQLMVNMDDQATRSQYGDAIQKQFDLMAAMTREVLQFARGESNLLIRKVYLHKFVDEVRQQLERELGGMGVHLEVDARYTSIAYFDELKLHRVIYNIARNAAQAMPGGGTFKMIVDSDDKDLLLEFSDTGHGIPKDIEGRVFELFATSGKKDGTGLGLAIVKKIVEEHHGRVSYTSSPAGTTFSIRLPLNRADSSGAIVTAAVV